MEEPVGDRKLRDELAPYLARIRRGARVVITDRGHPVAILLPYRLGEKSSRTERPAALLGGGHVSPAKKHLLQGLPLIRGRGPRLPDIVRASRR